MNGVTIFDISTLISTMLAAYEDYLFYSLTLMLAMAVLLGVKRLFVAGND